MKCKSLVKMNAFGAKMMATPGSKVATNFKGSRKIEKKGIKCVTRIAMKRCLQCEECLGCGTCQNCNSGFVCRVALCKNSVGVPIKVSDSGDLLKEDEYKTTGVVYSKSELVTNECPECGRFFNRGSIKNHIVSHEKFRDHFNNIKYDYVEYDSTKNGYKCIECSMKIFQRSHRHILLSHGE